MRELLLVLSFKMASILRNVLLPSWKVQMKNLASVVVFGGFAVGTFLVARGVTAYLLETANIGLFLYHRFLSMILYVFFVTVNISNLIVCFATLYRSDEVGFLMALPISHAKIFLLRFVDNFFYSSSTMALIGVSAILGYASYFGFPWYLSVFCILGVFLPFMLIAGVVAVVTLMGLIKVAVIVGVRVLLSVVGVVYLGAVYFYFRSTNPVHLVTSVLEQYPAINGYFGNLDPPFVHFLPSHWVSEFLYWSVVGNTDRAAPHFMFLFFTMFGLVVLAGLLARKWYYRTWLTASDAQAMKATRSGSSARTPVFRFDQSTRAQSFLLGNNPQGQLIFKRDFWMFFRDPGQWLHFLLMIVLVLIFLITVQSLDLPQTLPLMRAVGYLVVFIFIGFLVASVALRFVCSKQTASGANTLRSPLR